MKRVFALLVIFLCLGIMPLVKANFVPVEVQIGWIVSYIGMIVAMAVFVILIAYFASKRLSKKKTTSR